MKILGLSDEAALAVGNAAAFAGDLVHPALRLGVTGLTRAGKTVFITSLIHNFVNGGRLPLFRPFADGRIIRAYLQPQPDDAVPRFDYERNIAAITGEDPRWPPGTSRLSQLRLTLEYEPVGFLARNFGRGELNIDIIDYPGEWLLDLPLLTKSYETWSRETLALAREPARAGVARPWLDQLATLDANAPVDEQAAIVSARLFTGYLQECREDNLSLSTLPPGRFLMPGDLEGSPALTFAPLDMESGQTAPSGSLWQMMRRRYEAYKTVVVKPFFTGHFARLDRQIVLVDLLSALNTGAVLDLERALGDILMCFRTGSSSLLSRIFARKIDRILFAATKADHLHHTSHGQMEALLERLVVSAAEHAEFSGAEVGVTALAAIRATRETERRTARDTFNCVTGIPLAGERVDGRTFTGTEQVAVFPGDLPDNPGRLLEVRKSGMRTDLGFVRFRPPVLDDGGPLPHLRLDRALEFLMSDKLA